MFARFSRWRAIAYKLTDDDLRGKRNFFFKNGCACDEPDTCRKCIVRAKWPCVVYHSNRRAQGQCGFCAPSVSMLYEREALARIARTLEPLTEPMCRDLETLEWLTTIVCLPVRKVAERWTRTGTIGTGRETASEELRLWQAEDKHAEVLARAAVAAAKKLKQRIDEYFAPGGTYAEELAAAYQEKQLVQQLDAADTDDAALRRKALDSIRKLLGADDDAASSQYGSTAKRRRTSE